MTSKGSPTTAAVRPKPSAQVESWGDAEAPSPHSPPCRSRPPPLPGAEGWEPEAFLRAVPLSMPFRRMHGVEHREEKKQLGTRSRTPHVVFPGGRDSWLLWPCCQFYLALPSGGKVGWMWGGGERGVALPPLTLSPRFPFPRSGRCWSWTCATQWTVIRAEGTKTHLVPGTQTLCLLPGAEGIGCSYFLLPPFTLPEELWKIHPLDKTPRGNWMVIPPCSLRLTELLLFPAWPCLLRAPTVEGALDPESRGLRLAL